MDKKVIEEVAAIPMGKILFDLKADSEGRMLCQTTLPVDQVFKLLLCYMIDTMFQVFEQKIIVRP